MVSPDGFQMDFRWMHEKAMVQAAIGQKMSKIDI